MGNGSCGDLLAFLNLWEARLGSVLTESGTCSLVSPTQRLG